MKKRLLFISALLIGSFALLSMTFISTTPQDPWEVPAKYEKMKNPYAGDADGENIGKRLYSKHCKSCHGSKGKGDGPKAESVDTPIGDFTSETFKAQSDGDTNSMYTSLHSHIKPISDNRMPFSPICLKIALIKY